MTDKVNAGAVAGHCLKIVRVLSGRIRADRFHRESVKYTNHAFDKTTVHKRKSRNHLVDQIESFRIGDKDNKREDDLLDTFCYGIAIGLGNSEGF